MKLLAILAVMAGEWLNLPAHGNVVLLDPHYQSHSIYYVHEATQTVKLTCKVHPYEHITWNFISRDKINHAPVPAVVSHFAESGVCWFFAKNGYSVTYWVCGCVDPGICTCDTSWMNDE